MREPRILIIGAGDLCLRIGVRLVALSGIGRMFIAGRDLVVGAAKARFIASCGTVPVTWMTVDVSAVDQVAGLIANCQPHVLVNCAALHSPWALADRDDPVAVAFRNAGFAAQLPAQLPLLLNVMQAVRRTGFDGAIINCSYPDVTQPVLHRLGQAPTLGIGNAGMIHMMVEAILRSKGDTRRLQTIAHHSQVSMTAAAALSDVPAAHRPRVFLDGCEQSIIELLGTTPGLPLTVSLNEITAAHAVAVIAAWAGLRPELNTAAPGVHGLPGGWPIVVSEGSLDIDLPRGIDSRAVLDYHRDAARLDGVEAIEEDGTVRFTDTLRQALSRWPELGEPLHPAQARARYADLHHAMGLSA